MPRVRVNMDDQTIQFADGDPGGIAGALAPALQSWSRVPGEMMQMKMQQVQMEHGRDLEARQMRMQDEALALHPYEQLASAGVDPSQFAGAPERNRAALTALNEQAGIARFNKTHGPLFQHIASRPGYDITGEGDPDIAMGRGTTGMRMGAGGTAAVAENKIRTGQDAASQKQIAELEKRFHQKGSVESGGGFNAVTGMTEPKRKEEQDRYDETGHTNALMSLVDQYGPLAAQGDPEARSMLRAIRASGRIPSVTQQYTEAGYLDDQSSGGGAHGRGAGGLTMQTGKPALDEYTKASLQAALGDPWAKKAMGDEAYNHWRSLLIEHPGVVSGVSAENPTAGGADASPMPTTIMPVAGNVHGASAAETALTNAVQQLPNPEDLQLGHIGGRIPNPQEELAPPSIPRMVMPPPVDAANPIAQLQGQGVHPGSSGYAEAPGADQYQTRQQGRFEQTSGVQAVHAVQERSNGLRSIAQQLPDPAHRATALAIAQKLDTLRAELHSAVVTGQKIRLSKLQEQIADALHDADLVQSRAQSLVETGSADTGY